MKSVFFGGGKIGKRRSQISNFIVLGVILLMMIVLFLLIKRYVLSEVEPVKAVPPEFVELNTFIEECLSEVTLEAVEMIGMQGGFIYIPENVASEPKSYLTPYATQMIKLPYWYYEGQSRIPTNSFMQVEIEEYIRKNLPICIDEFSPVSDRYQVVHGEIKPLVILGDDEITSKIYYPITAKSVDKEIYVEMDLFSRKLDISLGRLHKLATDIIIHENENKRLESMTIDLMVIHPDIPFSDLYLDCDRREWNLDDVQEDTRQILYESVPQIRIKGTDNTPFPDEGQEFEKSLFEWDLKRKGVEGIRVGFKFDKDWPMYFDARPRKGDKLIPSDGQVFVDFFDLFCVGFHHFTYDLRYPVMITLRDPDALSGKGYEFSFVTPVYIMTNEPQRDIFANFDYRAPVRDSYYCDETTDVPYRIRAVENRYGFEIADVNITFECINYRCHLGKTGLSDYDISLVTELPDACNGGFIIAKHPDYIDSEKLIYFDGSLDPQEPILIQMQEVNNVAFEVYKHTIDNNPGLRKELSDGEFAIISMIEEEKDQDIFRLYPYFEGDMLGDTIPLLLGDSMNYTLDIKLQGEGEELIGGFKYEWNQSYEEVLEAEKVVFHVYEKRPFPLSEEEQETLMLELLGPENPIFMKPELV